MPDRAVVDDEYAHRCPTCGSAQTFACRDCTHLIPAQPRALVAISEDRQWLVARVSSVGMFRAFGFGIFKFDGRDYIWQESVLDTGQSADAVLAMWLAERGS